VRARRASARPSSLSTKSRHFGDIIGWHVTALLFTSHSVWNGNVPSIIP